MYHSFKDQHGNLIGTYEVYSLANAFNQDNPIMLTQEGREGAIYEMDNKAEIEEQREQEAQEQQVIAKKEVVDSEDYDEESKAQLLAEMNESIEAEQSVDKVALEKEATQDRVNEWVEYKDLATENKEVEVAEIAVEGQTRGWSKRSKRKLKWIFGRRIQCKKVMETRWITGVKTDSAYYKKDRWYKDIAIYNYGAGYCVPVSMAMIINYHHLINIAANDSHPSIDAALDQAVFLMVIATVMLLAAIIAARISLHFSHSLNPLLACWTCITPLTRHLS